ncbi:MAG: hypothetical protein ABIB46_00835 [bacterium]
MDLLYFTTSKLRANQDNKTINFFHISLFSFWYEKVFFLSLP